MVEPLAMSEEHGQKAGLETHLSLTPTSQPPIEQPGIVFYIDLFVSWPPAVCAFTLCLHFHRIPEHMFLTMHTPILSHFFPPSLAPFSSSIYTYTHTYTHRDSHTFIYMHTHSYTHTLSMYVMPVAEKFCKSPEL